MTDSHKKPPKDPLLEALEKAKKNNAGNEIEKLTKDLKEAELKIKETEEKLTQMTEIGRRAIADMENLKRRTEEDRTRMALFANIELIQLLLPSLQNARRAIAHTPKDLPENLNKWISGVTTIFGQIEQALQKMGVTEIKALNEKFDPKFHEALMQDKGPKDTVIEVLEPGYMIGEYVIAPAKVKVGMG
ncbi:MAG TPA: nucleotide exchange factor GrpE [Candidatus Gracilibacteria bacterium]|nr:nucleotide exchange factor GrpE [Candidatus Gracilibacteria bacterium]